MGTHDEVMRESCLNCKKMFQTVELKYKQESLIERVKYALNPFSVSLVHRFTNWKHYEVASTWIILTLASLTVVAVELFLGAVR